MAIDLERFINFINVELPKRIVLLHGSQYTGDPNLSSDPKVNYSPPGTFLMEYNTKELWRKKDTDKSSWAKIGGGNESDIKGIISDSIVAGDNILVDYDSYTGEITITGKPLSAEQVQDIIAPTLVGDENISITYDDTSDQLKINNDRTDADIVDLLNSTFKTDETISLTFNPTDDTITIKNSMDGSKIADLLSTKILAGEGVGVEHDPTDSTITIKTEITSSFVTDLLKDKLVAGDDVEILYDPTNSTITINSPKMSVAEIKSILDGYISAGDDIEITKDEVNDLLIIDSSIDVLDTVKNNLDTLINTSGAIEKNFDTTNGVLTIDGGDLITLNNLAPGKNIDFSYDPVSEKLSIHSTGFLEPNDMIPGRNIDFDYDPLTGEFAIFTDGVVSADNIVAGNNIYIDRPSGSNDIVINSTASGTGGVYTKDIVFSLGGELILGPQKQSEMVLPYEGILQSIIVNKSVSSSNFSNLIFSIDKLNTSDNTWGSIGNFELQVEENNKEFTLTESINNDTVRVSLVSGDWENIPNFNIYAKLQSGDIVEGDKDVVFMLGTSLEIGPQPKTEMYIPYEKSLESIIINKGNESSNTEDLIMDVEYYNESVDSWSTYKTLTLPSSVYTNLTPFTDELISNPTFRINLVSGDYSNVSNLSLIMGLKNTPTT